jgi:hypothetical protein
VRRQRSAITAVQSGRFPLRELVVTRADRSPTAFTDRRAYTESWRRAPYDRHHGRVFAVMSVAPIARRSSSTFGARTAIKKKKKIQSAIGRRCYKFLQCMSLQCRAIFFFVMKAKKKEKKKCTSKNVFL